MKEGDRMRKSAQNYPSMQELRSDRRRDSQLSQINRSGMKGVDDSMLSLFQRIPDQQNKGMLAQKSGNLMKRGSQRS